jgi:Mg/Co/Ni transporter MgtE
MAAGLPTEGNNAAQPRAGDLARRDVPTCLLDEVLGDVATRVAGAGWDACVVINERRIVLGLLRSAELAKDPTLLVERAMRPGPSTYRPYVNREELARVMTERDLESLVVTTSRGELVGVLRRADVMRASPGDASP